MQEGMLVLDALWLRRWYKRRHLHLGLAVHEELNRLDDLHRGLERHVNPRADGLLLMPHALIYAVFEIA